MAEFLCVNDCLRKEKITKILNVCAGQILPRVDEYKSGSMCAEAVAQSCPCEWLNGPRTSGSQRAKYSGGNARPLADRRNLKKLVDDTRDKGNPNQYRHDTDTDRKQYTEI